MATTFDQAAYTLEDRTRFSDESTAVHDIMDDGTLHVRVYREKEFRVFKCEFTPRLGSDADTLVKYIRGNAATEFDISYKGTTYRGYFIGTADTVSYDGDVSRVSARFRGYAV